MNETIEKYLKLPISEIREKIKENDKVLDELFHAWLPHDEYVKKGLSYWDDNYCLLTAKSLLLPKSELGMRPMTELDKECRMPIEKFKSLCESGYMSTYDGYAIYADENEVSSEYARIQAFQEGYIRNDFDYVCWYNK